MLQKNYLESIPSNLFSHAGQLPELLFANYIADEPDWTVSAISNKSWCEVLLATGGKAYYTIGRKSYTITAGDLIVLNQGMIHEARSDQADPIERWVCALRGVRLAGRAENHILYDHTAPVIPLGDQFEPMKTLFRLAMDACQHPGRNAYHVAQYAACTILSLIDEYLDARPLNRSADDEVTLARDVLNYIDRNYNQPLTIKSLSSHFFISADYLSHLVKNETGYSPISYMLSRRIGEAQRLLLSTMLPISRIAELTGYANINHFTAAFKKKIGISPSHYRQNYNIASIPRGAIDTSATENGSE